MCEGIVSMMELDKTVLEEAAALDVAKVHELRTPGIFKFLPRCNIPQNQEYVIRVSYSLPDSSSIAVGYDNIKALNAKISVLGQEISRLNKQMDELIARRDSPSSTDEQQVKPGQLLDDVVRLSFVDVLRPLYLTLEVTCVDEVVPISSNTMQPSDRIALDPGVDEVPGVSKPVHNIAAVSDLSPETDLPVGEKRKRSSEVEPSTPAASSGQKNEIQSEALKRARKKRRVDIPQESKGDEDVEFHLPLQFRPEQEDDGLDTVFESLRLQVEERSDDETMQVDTVDPQVLISASPEWDDLEAAESDDPLLVTEYSTEIVAYLKEAEKATMPNPNYIVDQEEMTWKTRCTLMDWVVQLHHAFRGNLETLFLCVNIIDRYLSKRSVRLEKLSLLGLIAYSVAAKYEQIFAPSRLQLSDLPTGHGISGAELFNGEIWILKTLDWNISAPGPLTWLRRGSKADDYEIQARTVAKYLMEVGCVEHRMLGFVPSLVAAASLWLARLSLGRLEWTATLVHYTTYTEKELIPVAEIILEHILLSPSPAEFVHAEYRKRVHFLASIHFKAWAVKRWEENTKIDLERDLPLIKAGKLKDEVGMEGVSQGSQG